MNKALNVMLLLLIGVAGVANAQSGENIPDSTHLARQATSQNYDSLQNEINQLKSRINLVEEERMQESIWKRKKYLKFGMMFPSVKYVEGDGNLSWETDFAFMFQQGKTAYLHAKPIGGMVKIGIDWGLLGFNYEKLKFKNNVAKPNTPANNTSLDLGMHKIEYAPHIGPSVSINPWNHLIVCAYFHVTPTASFILENDNFSYGFGCVMAAGVSVAHKGISLGVEGAWSTIKYTQAEIDDDEDSYQYDDDINIGSIFSTEKFKLKTTCPRIYLSIRW